MRSDLRRPLKIGGHVGYASENPTPSKRPRHDFGIAQAILKRQRPGPRRGQMRHGRDRRLAVQALREQDQQVERPARLIRLLAATLTMRSPRSSLTVDPIACKCNQSRIIDVDQRHCRAASASGRRRNSPSLQPPRSPHCAAQSFSSLRSLTPGVIRRCLRPADRLTSNRARREIHMSYNVSALRLIFATARWRRSPALRSDAPRHWGRKQGRTSSKSKS